MAKSFLNLLAYPHFRIEMSNSVNLTTLMRRIVDPKRRHWTRQLKYNMYLYMLWSFAIVVYTSVSKRVYYLLIHRVW